MTKLTTKEGEAVMWTASVLQDYAHVDFEDVRHPVAVLRQAGFSPRTIKVLGEQLEDIACVEELPEDIPGDIARCLILTCENTSWIDCYRTSSFTRNSPSHINEALGALRSLAEKLDERGIEVNHLVFE